VSAATERAAIHGSADLTVAWGFALYLALLLLVVPHAPPRWASLAALGAFGAMYLGEALSGEPVFRVAIVLYVCAGALVYRIAPPRLRALTVAAFALWTPVFRFLGPDALRGNYPVVLVVACVLALVVFIAAVVDRGASDQDERLRRVGLGLLAIACVSLISERHLVVQTVASVAPDDLWALVVVAVLPVVGVAKLRRPVRDALTTGVALGAYVLVAIALILGKGYHADTVAVEHRAAEILLAGEDPYVAIDIPEALRRFGLDPALATNFEDGSELRTFNYPALSFLVPAPFIALGASDIRFVYLGEIVVLVLVLVRHVGVPWRPLVTAAVVGNAVIMRQSVLAGVDPLWAVLVTFAFVFFARRNGSPALLGLACAARQPAWFFVPFYLAAAWRRDGGRAALRRTSIVALVGLIPNVPFLVAAPGAFIGGVLDPIFAPLEPYGVGLVLFSMDGVLPLLPRGAYGALSAAAFAMLLWLVWRRWPMLSRGAPVFPSVILWFAWRSLQNYFAFAGVLAMVGDEAMRTPADAPDSGGASPSVSTP
jgi:hypothetical protein